MPESIREALEAAYEGAESPEATRTEPETGGSAQDTPEPVRDTSSTTGQEPAAVGGEEDGLQAEEGQQAEAEKVTRARGPDGKFAKQGEQAAPVQPDAQQQPETPAPEGLKPPVSWKPAVREKWSTLPPDVQAEISRRETEIQRGLSQAANARKFTEEFFRVVNPYESLIRAQNSSPLQAVSNLMNTAARLSLGTPAQKAQVIAEIIGNYGVDIQTLDSVLAGQAPPDETDKIQQIIQQQLAPVQQFMQQIGQARQQRQMQLSSKIDTDIEQFAAKADFFEDVRMDMADILDMAARRGQELSLEEAYNRAVAMNPEIAKIVEQRRSAQRQGTSQQDLQRARAAASSVRGSPPAAGAKGQPDSLRGALEAAWEQSGNR